ncbi:hypothetical protein Csa_015455 [Cucumis sativus]|uniref:Uncharacterized protein n=1 Tax=Cucumis sativus TaxID=3659 RepID=A0A0A0LDZ2_CUCSA|nr:hypothetical protein Csa_015455 [Cucumis sativus]
MLRQRDLSGSSLRNILNRENKGKKQVPRWKGQVEMARSKAEFWLLDVKKAETSKEREGLRGRNVAFVGVCCVQLLDYDF